MTGNRFAETFWRGALCVIVSGHIYAEPLTSGAGSLPPTVTPTEPETQTSKTGILEPPKPGSPGTIDRSVVGNEAPSASKTVELLLEMQGKNPGLAGGERPKAEVSPSRPSAGTAGATKPAFGADGASPFGSVEALPAKPAVGDSEAVDWSEAPGSRFGGGLATGSGASREPYRPGSPAARAVDEDDARWLIPRKLIRFVRENRDTVVLGSVALLLMVWGVSAFASGRRK